MHCLILGRHDALRAFTTNKLGLSKRQLRTVTWPEVAHRIVEVGLLRVWVTSSKNVPAMFTTNKLGLSMRQLQTVTWPEVAHRTVEVRSSVYNNMPWQQASSCKTCKCTFIINTLGLSERQQIRTDFKG